MQLNYQKLIGPSLFRMNEYSVNKLRIGITKICTHISVGQPMLFIDQNSNQLFLMKTKFTT